MIKEEKIAAYSKALECYALGYGGGLVLGDNMQINMITKQNLELVLLSPSSGKVFKHMQGRCKTIIKLIAP